MRERRRSRWGSGLVVLAVPMVAASAAWACSPQKSVSNPAPQSGPPGQVVRISGSAWEEGPIEARWDGARGPLLAASGDTTGPSFDMTVTIPQRATGGVHSVYIVGPDSPGSVNQDGTSDPEANVKEVRFEVATSGGSGSSQDGPAETTPPQEPANGETAPPPATDSSPQEPANEAPAPAPAASAGGSGSGLSGSKPATGSADSQTTPEADTVGVEPGDVPEFTSEGDQGITSGSPSERSVGSDLWSGFTDGRSSRAASLTDQPTLDGGSDQRTFAGLLIGGIGAGLLVVALQGSRRRRQVVATTPADLPKSP